MWEGLGTFGSKVLDISEYLIGCRIIVKGRDTPMFDLFEPVWLRLSSMNDTGKSQQTYCHERLRTHSEECYFQTIAIAIECRLRNSEQRGNGPT